MLIVGGLTEGGGDLTPSGCLGGLALLSSSFLGWSGFSPPMLKTVEDSRSESVSLSGGKPVGRVSEFELLKLLLPKEGAGLGIASGISILILLVPLNINPA